MKPVSPNKNAKKSFCLSLYGLLSILLHCGAGLVQLTVSRRLHRRERDGFEDGSIYAFVGSVIHFALAAFFFILAIFLETTCEKGCRAGKKCIVALPIMMILINIVNTCVTSFFCISKGDKDMEVGFVLALGFLAAFHSGHYFWKKKQGFSCSFCPCTCSCKFNPGDVV
eukprot:m.2991 g.2991  ORF g.2991 m.2991 type:complete len:169 (+) comp9000_c0_seq2:102-608(+)